MCGGVQSKQGMLGIDGTRSPVWLGGSYQRVEDGKRSRCQAAARSPPGWALHSTGG